MKLKFFVLAITCLTLITVLIVVVRAPRVSPEPPKNLPLVYVPPVAGRTIQLFGEHQAQGRVEMVASIAKIATGDGLDESQSNALAESVIQKMELLVNPDLDAWTDAARADGTLLGGVAKGSRDPEDVRRWELAASTLRGVSLALDGARVQKIDPSLKTLPTGPGTAFMRQNTELLGVVYHRPPPGAMLREVVVYGKVRSVGAIDPDLPAGIALRAWWDPSVARWRVFDLILYLSEGFRSKKLAFPLL